jgi:hypothetical protein
LAAEADKQGLRWTLVRSRRVPTSRALSGAAGLITLLTGIVSTLAGCATTTPHRPITRAPVPEGVFVIAQACFPAGLDRTSIGVETVTPDSTGGGGEALTGRTSTGQPVFEFHTAHPTQLRAVLVRELKPDGTLIANFVFQPPTRVEYDSWSAWQQASNVSDREDVSIAMVNGAVQSLKAVPATAPMARYRLMPFQQHLADRARRRQNGLDVALPRCDAAGS